MNRYIYRVQGVDGYFTTKAAAVKYARSLGAAVRACCERLRLPIPKGLWVTQHEKTIDEPSGLVASGNGILREV